MEKKINLEEILWESFHNNGIPKPTHTLAKITQKAVKEAMKETCRQVLELAAENAKIDVTEEYDNGGVRHRYSHKCKSSLRCSEDDYYYQLNKQSILNTINQVE